MTDTVKSSETTAATAGPRPTAKDPDAPVQDRDSLMRWLPFISTPIRSRWVG